MRMVHTPESTVERGVTAPDEDAPARPPFTPDGIRAVRDFTARKTLEQAHAFVHGLASLEDGDDGDRALLADLAAAGLTAEEAAALVEQAVSLMALMADRDEKAEIFHAAVKEAGLAERAMYERLAGIARTLRNELGDRSPMLAKLGVPPAGGDIVKARPRPGKAIFSAAAGK